jgi:hypothetical protein
MLAVVDAANLTRDFASHDFLRGEQRDADDRRTQFELLVDQIEFADVVVLNKMTPQPGTAGRQPPYASSFRRFLSTTSMNRFSDSTPSLRRSWNMRFASTPRQPNCIGNFNS